MKFTRVRLKNWKNFANADVQLQRRMFVVGPNAIGKLNFLDAFRFLCDLVVKGGLSRAVEVRGGMSRLRSLHAWREPEVGIRVEFEGAEGTNWIYRIAFSTQWKRSPLPTEKREIVARKPKDEEKSKLLLRRLNSADKGDPRLLTQTHLQQINTNREFRELADAFASIMYLHVVPQLICEGQAVASGMISEHVLGRDLPERMRRTPKKSRDTRFKRIEQILRIAVPQFKRLTLTEADERGRPHQEVEFMHWRATGARQNETQFSDGTLCLIGLVWALQEKGGGAAAAGGARTFAALGHTIAARSVHSPRSAGCGRSSGAHLHP